MSSLPKIISVDDHVVEPPDLWTARMAGRHHEWVPHVVRQKGIIDVDATGRLRLLEGDTPNARWCDIWVYDDMVWPFTVGYANVGRSREERRTVTELTNYDEMLPGCYDQAARLADMDANHTEASMCFPTVPRFCGQAFLERKDKHLALECLKVYNDWIIDEWCGGQAHGRLIPNTVIPLWDAGLAAEEVKRCASKGSHAVAFSEAPYALGLPSIHSGAWEPLFRACDETETVINMHIGSSSKLPSTSSDAPFSVTAALIWSNAMLSVTDWLLSGVLARHPTLKIAMSEGQIGWMPFLLQRIDDVWERGEMFESDVHDRVRDLPSSYIKGRVYGCIFDDVIGLKDRGAVGIDQIMFEVDYPHGDSTFPNSAKVVEKLAAAAELSEHETWKVVRGNAIECYGLTRYGISD
ncbi:amidohydrolase family protein [Mycobacterium sp. SP-6446]|uniref:amidohydrolase family protein n=1 Tax=Mycobacterium sp. SP-6446 TaxID=1834162 RepID=UPI00096DFB75|nr:amidohydrolase family protein [Mycobacterium sp. SP-6446]OMC08015.1 amidohydrolase [Mycobacterium sp. SP-6446]